MKAARRRMCRLADVINAVPLHYDTVRDAHLHFAGTSKAAMRSVMKRCIESSASASEA